MLVGEQCVSGSWEQRPQHRATRKRMQKTRQTDFRLVQKQPGVYV